MNSSLRMFIYILCCKDNQLSIYNNTSARLADENSRADISVFHEYWSIFASWKPWTRATVRRKNWHKNWADW
ncbi:unknown [Prevotella sp. CAG:1124]|nr:unknown [Prevotella sp. CAG:1124]